MRRRSTTLALAISASLLAAFTVAGAEPAARILVQDRPADPQVTAATRLALARTQALHGRAIGSDTRDGVVLLHGMVGSAAERTRALRVTQRVPGVREVRDALRVVPVERQREAALADALLAGRIEIELGHDAALWEDPLGVHAVHDGVAILAGDVSTPERHERAIELASQVEGVRELVSLVRSPDRERDAELWAETAPAAIPSAPSGLRAALSDAWLKSRLKLALWVGPGLSPIAVDVDARDGVVTLFGSVASTGEKEAAFRRALDVDGVLLVDDDLQVVPPFVAETVEAVDEGLEREIERRIDSERLEDPDISVSVRNATVRLEGSVATHDDRRKAIRVAFSTDGVRDVSDGLEVRSHRG